MKGLIVILLLALFLVSCARIPDTVHENIRENKEIISSKEMGAELKGIIAKKDNVDSYEYFRKEGPGGNNYYVKGDKVKIGLTNKIRLDVDSSYDVIYLDLSKKTAEAYCEDQDYYDCEDTGKVADLSFESVYKITPKELIESVDYAEIVEKARYDDKDCVIIEYTNSAGNIERIWVWDYRGLPLRHKVMTPDKATILKEVFYEHMVVNRLKDSDVRA